MKSLRLLSALSMLSVALLFTSCAKDDDPQPTPTPAPPTSSNYIYFFKANLDGKAVEVGQKKFSFDYSNGLGSAGTGGPDTSYQVTQYTYFSHVTDDTKPEYTVGMITTFKGYFSSPDYQTRADAITLGNHPYGDDDPFAEKDGAIVEYLDENDVFWTTYFGSGDQSGSSFKITNYTDNTDGFSAKIIEAEFSCTLYDGNGNSIVVKNGEVKGRIVLF